jgi:hypothetical protein
VPGHGGAHGAGRPVARRRSRCFDPLTNVRRQ